MKTLAWVFLILGVLSLCVSGGIYGVQTILFKKDCAGYLKRAADANTVDLALSQMEIAIRYIETNGMTEGYTSIVYNTPDEDLGYWYTNLVAARDGLLQIDENSSELERSNVLMKLRETLLDSSGTGDTLTYPKGIGVFPLNTIAVAA
tara:strand:- start:169 stop:612 length:444 start_codon:yes stop_codon:yes gene_type:complete